MDAYHPADEATRRHVHTITLALVCELNSAYCSSGPDVSLTTGHMTRISARSLSMTFGTASALLIQFITKNLTYETSLSSKFVPPFSSEQSPLNITSDAESYTSDHRLSKKAPVRHDIQYPRISVNQSNPDIRSNGSFPRLVQRPNNNDATFMDHQLPKPADLLLQPRNCSVVTAL